MNSSVWESRFPSDATCDRPRGRRRDSAASPTRATDASWLSPARCQQETALATRRAARARAAPGRTSPSAGGFRRAALCRRCGQLLSRRDANLACLTERPAMARNGRLSRRTDRRLRRFVWPGLELRVGPSHKGTLDEQRTIRRGLTVGANSESAADAGRRREPASSVSVGDVGFGPKSAVLDEHYPHGRTARRWHLFLCPSPTQNGSTGLSGR